jgi:hypothetical protein
MKIHKLSILISAFNLFLMLFIFLGSSSGENGVMIGSNCRLTEDGTNFKVTYNGETRLIINKSTGNITAGSVEGTGAGTIYSDAVNANSISGTLNAVPRLELTSKSGVSLSKGNAYIYQNSGKLILAYADDFGSSYYFWVNLSQIGDINTWTYSPTEP